MKKLFPILFLVTACGTDDGAEPRPIITKTVPAEYNTGLVLTDGVLVQSSICSFEIEREATFTMEGSTLKFEGLDFERNRTFITLPQDPLKGQWVHQGKYMTVELTFKDTEVVIALFCRR